MNAIYEGPLWTPSIEIPLPFKRRQIRGAGRGWNNAINESETIRLVAPLEAAVLRHWIQLNSIRVYVPNHRRIDTQLGR